MLPWIEARRQLLAAVNESTPPQSCPLTEAVGRTLAADLTADRDSPPFDKAMMDGFALRSVDHAAGTLPIAGDQPAGPGEAAPLPERSAIRIMTGAPVPPEATAVVPIEQTDAIASQPAAAVTFTGQPPRDGANILRRGTITAKGDALAAAGTLLAPRHLAMLAEFGHAAVPVRSVPSVAIIATGDELVPHDQVPGPGQIRNSNAPMLAAQIAAAGGQPHPLGIAADDRGILAERIDAGLHHDVLLLSGGVSAGDYDFVPQLLAEAGVTKMFHKVAIKPGKPLWVGTRLHPDDASRTQFVFGLPGNPVSSFVCFELFVRPTLAALLGRSVDTALPTATLTTEHHQKGDRVTFWPATLDGDRITPLPWKGSADLVHLAAANALIVIPAGTRTWEDGDTMEYVAL